MTGSSARFRGEPVPATGFSIGVSRLLSALQMLEEPDRVRRQQPGPVVVLGDGQGPRSPPTSAWSPTLRQAGIRAELYLGSSGMKAQMKYADRRSSPCVDHPGLGRARARRGRRSRI